MKKGNSIALIALTSLLFTFPQLSAHETNESEKTEFQKVAVETDELESSITELSSEKRTFVEKYLYLGGKLIKIDKEVKNLATCVLTGVLTLCNKGMNGEIPNENKTEEHITNLKNKIKEYQEVEKQFKSIQESVHLQSNSVKNILLTIERIKRQKILTFYEKNDKKINTDIDDSLKLLRELCGQMSSGVSEHYYIDTKEVNRFFYEAEKTSFRIRELSRLFGFLRNISLEILKQSYQPPSSIEKDLKIAEAVYEEYYKKLKQLNVEEFDSSTL